MIGGVCAVAQHGDREAMEALWMLSFPEDTASDIAAFFDRFFRDGQAFVCKQDDRVLSMLFLLPASLCSERCRRPVGYVYAGATHPDARGQGCYRLLLRYVRKWAKERGMAALFLRPADAALATSYRRMGFTDALTATVWDATVIYGDASAVSRLTPADYTRLRRRFLNDRRIPFVDWDDAVIDHALTYATAVSVGHAAALYTVEDDRLMIWELLADVADRETALSAIGAYSGINRVSVRTTGTEETIGLLDPIEPIDITPAYMGYGLE